MNRFTSSNSIAASGLIIVAGFVVVAAAWMWLDWAQPPLLITDDSVRDLLLARDCIDLGRCHSAGSPTSLAGFHQGAVWVDTLTALRWAGLDARAQFVFVLVLAAIACGTIFVSLAFHLHREVALPAAALFAVFHVKDDFPAQLVSGGSSSLPNTLASLGIILFALHRRTRFLVLAAFGWALAVNEHVVSLTLLPALLASALLFADRPLRALGLAVAIAVSMCVITSSAAWLANLAPLFDGPWPLVALVAAAIATTIALRLNPSVRRLRPASRVVVSLAAILLPFAGACIWLVVDRDHHFSTHYLNPILTPLAVVAGYVVCAPFLAIAKWNRAAGWWNRAAGWLPSLVAIAALTYATLYHPNSLRLGTTAMARWSLDDARRVSEAASAAGRSFEDLRFRLQTADCRILLARIALFSDPPPDQPPDTENRDNRQIRLRPLTAGESTRHATQIDLSNGPHRFAEIASWLRPSRLRACRQEAAGPAECQPAADENPPPQDTFLFSQWAYPGIHSLQHPLPYTASYTIPVEPVAGMQRALQVVDEDRRCPWQIVAIEGLRADRPLPSSEIVLRSPDGTAGHVVVARRFDSASCHGRLDMRFPPCLVESDSSPIAAARERSLP